MKKWKLGKMIDKEGRQIVIFHLSKIYRGRNLYNEFINGIKTSEFKDNNNYWIKRLIDNANHDIPIRAWLLFGFPKDNIPRLEADIIDIIQYKKDYQIEVKLKNIIEITY